MKEIALIQQLRYPFSSMLKTYILQHWSLFSLQVKFFVVFGVLFSGVTGIMAGANMSGELVSPGKNIPRGTLGACLFTLATLAILALFTALTCDPSLLMHDCMYMSDISVWPPIVAIGVLLATFSASLNNLIGRDVFKL